MRLLEVKLTAPRITARAIARPRVDGLLDGGLDVPLTLVSAPPGYGKSTAVAAWLAASGARASAWLNLDEADDYEARFLAYLWAAAARLMGHGTEADATRAIPTATANDALEEIAVLLMDAPEPSVLVLDDLHVVRSAAVIAHLGRLVEVLPAQVHLVIATRVDPALPLGRLRASGRLVELRAADLRYSVDEVRAFLDERMDVRLSEGDLLALADRTEGWPAVVQLAGLTLHGRTDSAVPVRELATTNRFVLDYVAEEVLGGLDDDLHEFLVRTSILDRLTGPLCDALTERRDGAATLTRLERSNLLVVPLDEARTWYRYHALFGDVLRARLTAWPTAEVRDLHARAARWFDVHGDAGAAFEHAVRADDADHARRLVTACAPDFVHGGEFTTLLDWLARLPRGVSADAFLLTMRAWALVLSGATDGLERELRGIEEALATARTSERPALTVPAHLEMIRSVDARQRGDAPAAVAHAERARALIPVDLSPERETLVVGDALAILGHAQYAAGDLDASAEAYRAAAPLLRRAGNWLGVADITRNLARLEARRGRLRHALDACDALLSEGPSASDRPAFAAVHLARAEVLDRAGDRRAVEAADNALELARRGGDPVTSRDARRLLERLALRPPPDDGASSSALDGPPALVEPLTERELEVLRLVARGRSNREIAAELFLSLGTVKSHVHAIAGKLGASNRVEAVANAREARLLD